MKELFGRIVEAEYQLWSSVVFIVAVTAPVWFLFFTGFVLGTLDGNSFGEYKEIFALFIISIIGIFYTYLTYLLLNYCEGIISIIFVVILMLFALWLGPIIVPFAIGALFWYFLAIKIFHNASNKVWWLTTIAAIIYLPFALVFGFIAGWWGLSAGGAGP